VVSHPCNTSIQMSYQENVSKIPTQKSRLYTTKSITPPAYNEMADDGLQINFSLGDGALESHPTFKGGPWRARRKITRQRQAREGFIPAPEHAPPTRETDWRPTKRQRIDNPNFEPALARPTRDTAPRQNNERANTGPKQIISSLFTFNPASKTEEEARPEPEEEVDVAPSNAPLTPEQQNFTSLGLSPTMASHLTNKMGVTAPTAIQKASMEALLDNDGDAFIQAETGSGKTLAYLLPIIQRIMQLSTEEQTITRNSGLFAVILAPTRELSKQIASVLESLIRCVHWIVPGIVVGGEKMKSEKARLRKGVNILVATPGRLADHLANTEVLDVSCVRWLVLDEGDRLMELGFEDDIKKLVDKLDLSMQSVGKGRVTGLPSKRINILCSATMKMDVQRLGEISLKEAVHIQAQRPDSTGDISNKNEEETFSAPAQLKQSYAVVPNKLRLVTLAAMLKRTFARRGSAMKVIVFISCADSVDFHFQVFTRDENADTENANSDDDGPTPKANEKRSRSSKYSKALTIPVPAGDPITSALSPAMSNDLNKVTAYRLHGSLPQNIRTKTIKAFSSDPNPAFLICTDVASRGLDVPNVDLVIEYDPAFSKDEHIHRIGRTARAGRDGRASIFLQPGNEEGYVSILKEGRRDGGINLTRHTAEELIRKGFAVKDASGIEKEGGWDLRSQQWHLAIERWVLDNPKILEAARRGFQSHVRAYATHVAAERVFFDIKELHLGHLAKAFGLRDKPGSINVPGLRQAAGQVKQDRKSSGKGKKSVGSGMGTRVAGGGRKAIDAAKEAVVEMDKGMEPERSEAQEAQRRMRNKAKMMMGGGADEFNLA
jgi:ATP-dependent RNA helicase DDX31/DBP7